MECAWGLLGAEFLPNSRRNRTLELGVSVRRFNDLAVPGLGGVWYGKQLLLATLGVAVAEAARDHGATVRNIEVANAIEALACWLAFKNNGWRSDARLRGNTKLKNKDDFKFQQARERNFYVSQPMRVATVQALPALGFVHSDSARFNAFRCSDQGRGFIEMATREFNKDVTAFLTQWVLGDKVKPLQLQSALSPLEPLPKDAIRLLRERLIDGGNESHEDKQRRANALAWVESLRTPKTARPTWAQRPQTITEEHWHDLHAGALFFATREAAIVVLDVAEAHIENQPLSLCVEIPKGLKPSIEALKTAAHEYLQCAHTDKEAKTFCIECVNNDPLKILRSLVKRDGKVLRLVGDEVKSGSAFRGAQGTAERSSADDDTQGTPQALDIHLPKGISYRMKNLYLFNLDMRNKLNEWLNLTAVEGQA